MGVIMIAVDRQALAERFNNVCPWCGLPLGSAFAVHHRKLRKHGGTNDPHNLVALHHGCHNLHTRSVHLQPAAAYEWGYLVPSWDDPATVPLRVKGGEWVQLNADGTHNTTHKEQTSGW